MRTSPVAGFPVVEPELAAQPLDNHRVAEVCGTGSSLRAD